MFNFYLKNVFLLNKKIGYVSRQFVRRYQLPKGHDINNVNSSLSSDGVLTITAPTLALPAAKGEKVVPIQQTAAPAVQ